VTQRSPKGPPHRYLSLAIEGCRWLEPPLPPYGRGFLVFGLPGGGGALDFFGGYPCPLIFLITLNFVLHPYYIRGEGDTYEDPPVRPA
jgi:hypothetical protein